MKKILVTLIWIVISLGVGFAVYHGFIVGPKEIKKIEKKRPVPVTITPVKLSSISEILEISGEIQANKSVIIKSKVPGRLEQLRTISNSDDRIIPVKEGVSVRKGQEIAVIGHDSSCPIQGRRFRDMGANGPNCHWRAIAVNSGYVNFDAHPLQYIRGLGSKGYQ